ncbi:MAG: DUF3179 domain-containing (seleno)protein [Nitrososphaerales archaeon]
MKSYQRYVLLAAVLAIIVGIIITIENPFNIQEDPIEVVPEGLELGINVGDVAPSFTLQTVNGVTVSLSDFRGKVVFINFWATWCPFCVEEMPDIQKVHEELGDSLVVLGINRAESFDKQLEFFAELDVDITYTILLDPTDSAASRYGVRVMPTSYFLDPNGVITSRHFGQITHDDMHNAIEEAGAAPIEPRSSDDGEIEIMVTNGVKHTVPLDKILSGGPGKDGIPSIDNPQFISASEADTFLNDADLVLGIDLNGEVKAYPQRILVWHEIVNDLVGGIPVTVTYCPLCYTGAAFERVIDGETVEFGVSGKLYNSDLVMYDRKTDSYWSQITGQSIVGELAGRTLKRLPLDTLEWQDWKKIHPDTKVLSTDTGFSRNYNADPYAGYYRSDSTIFPIENVDKRLHLKTIVHGVLINDEAKAYPEEEVKTAGLINDIVGGTPILILYSPEANAVKIYERTIDDVTLEFKVENGMLVDTSSGTTWSYSGEGLSGKYADLKLNEVIAPPHFWFAWAAFYPDTGLFTTE